MHIERIEGRCLITVACPEPDFVRNDAYDVNEGAWRSDMPHVLQIWGHLCRQWEMAFLATRFVASGNRQDDFSSERYSPLSFSMKWLVLSLVAILTIVLLVQFTSFVVAGIAVVVLVVALAIAAFMAIN